MKHIKSLGLAFRRIPRTGRAFATSRVLWSVYHASTCFRYTHLHKFRPLLLGKITWCVCIANCVCSSKLKPDAAVPSLSEKPEGDFLNVPHLFEISKLCFSTERFLFSSVVMHKVFPCSRTLWVLSDFYPCFKHDLIAARWYRYFLRTFLGHPVFSCTISFVSKTLSVR